MEAASSLAFPAKDWMLSEASWAAAATAVDCSEAEREVFEVNEYCQGTLAVTGALKSHEY